MTSCKQKGGFGDLKRIKYIKLNYAGNIWFSTKKNSQCQYPKNDVINWKESL